MKKLLTDNIGLKILALVAATIMWLVVVNVDDPVVEKRFSGINVEVANDEAITRQNKTYEILDDTDTITVIVKGKRSVLDQMSKDYIKATADIKNLTIMDTVPIEVRSTRLSDRLESIVPTTKNLKVHIEELDRKQIEILVSATGTVNAGSVLGTIKPDVNILSVSGPVSVVQNIAYAKAEIDVTGLGKDVSTTAAVHLYDADDNLITDQRIKSTVTSVHVDAQILETKQVEVSAITSGNPAEGYALTGIVNCDPSTVLVAGRGTAFQELNRIVIPENVVSVAGATDDVTQYVDIAGYLPEGIRLADREFDGSIEVYVQVEKMMSIEMDIPVENISIINVPDGYTAHLVEIGPTKRIEIQGISTALVQANASLITGTIDASTLSPRITDPEEQDTEGVRSGSNDGTVTFSVPTGISVIGPVYMEVILMPVSAEEGTTE
ncbi:MAG: hypothetical protein J5518_04995 [Lachnospiraceae bacterium]|nr:hypothetical protein [Lachnospiraceae bacterium]